LGAPINSLQDKRMGG